MKIRRIEFRNFRGFGTFDLDVGGQDYFLIGENGSGKSSLLTGIARAMGRDLTFSASDFADIGLPIELRVVLDELDTSQQGVFAQHAAFGPGLPSLTLEARSVWDAAAEEAETEHRFPGQNAVRTRRSERDALPLLWLSASRDARRQLDLGNPTNLMGRLVQALPIQASLTQAVADIQAAGTRLAGDVSLAQLLVDAQGQLTGLVPDVSPTAFSLGVSATTPRELLRQLNVIVEHLGEPIGVDRQSSGIAQLTVFVFALLLARHDPGVILLIDEPEISLHPQAQRSLVRSLTSLGSQLLVATHSPSLLERVDPRRVMRLRRNAGNIAIAQASALSAAEAQKLARHTTPQAADAFFARTVVLVEGLSDTIVLSTIASRMGRNLDAEGISIVPLGGAGLFGTYVHLLGSRGLDLRVAGLVDDAEERYVIAALAGEGHAATLSRADREALGYFVCVSDLEDELMRSIGTAGVQAVIANQGDSVAFATYQGQPSNAALTIDRQVRGFIGKRKVEYAPALADACPIGALPTPIAGLIAHV